MNIEGTPNERAMIVIFSYISGFTAAFILLAFSNSSPDVGQLSATVASHSQSANVIDSVAREAAPTDEATASTPITDIIAVYENNGLYVYTGEEFPTLLSKNIAATDLSYDDMPELADRSGFHTNVLVYQVFADTDLVYFCEQYGVTGECTPFLYDTSEQVLRVISDGGVPLTLTTREARTAVRTSAGSLVIAGYQSTNPAQPWLVEVR